MSNGIGVSEGIVIGKVLKLDKEIPSIVKKTILEEEIVCEKKKLQEAIDLSRSQLVEIQSEADEVTKDILEAHIMMLEDVELINMIIGKIEGDFQDAASAICESIRYYVDLFVSLEDPYLRERAADMEDIGNRMVMNLLGKKMVSPKDIKEPVVLVARDIAPSDTAQMNRDNILGFITEQGGETSHCAIMAKNLGIPAIVGFSGILNKVSDGDMLCFDGKTGELFISPDADVLKKFEESLQQDKENKLLLKSYCQKRCITIDGHEVSVTANISSAYDAKKALENGAEGVGLFRTEFLYMNRKTLPTEEEQYRAYKEVLECMGDHPVVIRTLDIGGDKELPYLSLGTEKNPFLGYRAIRICLDQKDIFKTQLRALVRASIHGNLKIMYPMISSYEEVKEANAILKQCCFELEEEGYLHRPFEVGVMMEIPSAALSADLIAKEVDFFSIGTNDLIQYLCAVDRMNEKVSSLYSGFHPAVTRLIKSIIEIAHQNKIPCKMCGETAADVRLIPLYLAMGLDEFSMNAGSILKAKKLITELRFSKSKQALNDVLKMKTAKEIADYMNELVYSEGLI